MDEVLDRLAKWTLFWSLIVFGFLALATQIEVDYNAYPDHEELTQNEKLWLYLFVLFWSVVCVAISIARYGYQYKEEIKKTIILQEPDNLSNIARYILQSRNKSWIIRVLCKPFYNALKKGASMHETDSLKFFLQIVSCVVLSAIFFYNFYHGDGYVHLLFVLLFCCTILVCIVSRYGFKHRNLIELTDDVAPFDSNVAFSGGLWGGVGVGLYALFTEFDTVVEFFKNLFGV